MFLSLLNQKETLKFLDLAIYMVDIDGEPTEIEKSILEKMFREVGYIVNEYSFEYSESIEDTVDFFVNSNRIVKSVVFLNLVKITMTDDLYNTTEHLFLEQIQEKFDITPERRRELMSLVYEERDLRERAARVLKD
jgi:alpha-galactosidase/6-phospho-beta-glucosidase family protein